MHAIGKQTLVCAIQGCKINMVKENSNSNEYTQKETMNFQRKTFYGGKTVE